MSTSYLEVSPTQTQTQTKDQFIFVLQLHSGKLVIGKASNVAKRIAAINSGMSSFIKQSHQVNRILGVKPVNAERNLPSVVKSFCDKYGADKVITVWATKPPACRQYLTLLITERILWTTQY